MSGSDYFAVLGAVLIAPHLPFKLAGPVALLSLLTAMFWRVGYGI